MDRTEICDEKFEELFGSKRMPSDTDPEFMDILQKFIFGQVSQVGTLDNKMRELITITVLSCLQALPQLKSHVGACLHVGLSPIEIREAIYQCAPFIGFPRTLNAISTMNEVFKANKLFFHLQIRQRLLKKIDFLRAVQFKIQSMEMRLQRDTKTFLLAWEKTLQDF